MPYTAQKPPLRRSIEELKATIPGWGVDLDPADRPGVPNQPFAPELTGAHWDFPERQPETWPRERSIEHKFLTPVFGTSCPPEGLSGAIRKFAYAKYSEGRAAHWLLLVAADRVDVAESRITSLLQGKPDNIIGETGVQHEWKRHPLGSRFGKGRADLKHMWMDPLISMGPYLLMGYGAYSLYRAVSGSAGGLGAATARFRGGSADDRPAARAAASPRTARTRPAARGADDGAWPGDDERPRTRGRR
ncbi:MAG TPA: hypothetical protein VF665_05320 [Longimicrobium sp.]|jgi:hypothetical protein